MQKEWTLEQIREFVKKDYQSVSARFTKCLLSYYDELLQAKSQPSSEAGLLAKGKCLHDGKINQGHHPDQPSYCDKCGEEL